MPFIKDSGKIARAWNHSPTIGEYLMYRTCSNLLIILTLVVLPWQAQAADSLSSDIVLSGGPGQCTREDPCKYRVTSEDVGISGGIFSFNAESTGLCYDQYIVVRRNRRVALAVLMSGTDRQNDSFKVKANDLLSVYVIELPAPHVCVWAGELYWTIMR